MKIVDLLKGALIQIKTPVNQSLVLMLSTVFVLGSQFALWQSGSDVKMTGSYVPLLVLFLLKNSRVLYQEIKEAPSHDNGNSHSSDAG